MTNPQTARLDTRGALLVEAAQLADMPPLEVLDAIASFGNPPPQHPHQHEWRHFVSEAARERWDSLHVEAKLVAFTTGTQAANDANRLDGMAFDD